MKDIQKAIGAQKEYREALKLNPFCENISTYLAPYGYTNLDEFQQDKIDYLLKNGNIPIIITTPEDGIKTTLSNFNNKIEQAVLCINNDKIFAWQCDDAIDPALFEDYGIPLYGTKASGGTILGSPDDLDIAFIISTDYCEDISSEYFNHRLARCLQNHLPDYNITEDNNDILINDKKIVGTTTQINNNMFLYMAHISFYDFSALTKILCSKESTKTPGYMPAELSRATLLEEMKSWFK